MTPTALQTLAPAAPAQTGPGRRAAPEDEPGTFAAVLDGSVRSASGDGEQAGSGDHEVATEAREEDGTEITVAAGDQPRLDALALMLAAATPGQATPGAAAATSAGAGSNAAVSDALAAAAQARAAFDGTAASMWRRVPAQAAATQPDGADRGRVAAAPDGLAGIDPAADEAAALAAFPGALRREAPAGPAHARPVPASAAADDVKGTGAAGGPDPARAAAPPATALSVLAGMQDATGPAPATPGKPEAFPAAPTAAQRLPADPEGAPAAASATRALQPGPAAAQDAPPAPAEGLGAIDPAGPGMSVATASAAASPGPVAQLAPPVGSPDWAPALAQQLVRLPGGGAVELNLNPVELGPLRVKLSVVEGQAQVQFVAEHAAVRHALEAALPQLRTSLAENGISLGHANVGAGAGEPRTGQDGGQRPPPGSEPEARARADEPAAAGPRSPHLRAAGTGAVDTFA